MCLGCKAGRIKSKLHKPIDPEISRQLVYLLTFLLNLWWNVTVRLNSILGNNLEICIRELSACHSALILRNERLGGTILYKNFLAVLSAIFVYFSLPQEIICFVMVR